MLKRNQYLLLAAFAVLLAILAHFSGRMAATPAFTFADERREVFLTFDDGPSTVVTGKILDTLQEENIKATFFVVGERVYGRKEVLKRMVREGHTVGVHSQSHRYDEIYASAEALVGDVQACAKLIEETTGVAPKVYRFPGGGRHEREEEILQGLGYHIVWWNAVNGDAELTAPDAQTLAETALRTSKGKKRVVLLMHDRADCAATAEALPAIIKAFREEGCVFRAF